jgi:hypothetical protein
VARLQRKEAEEGERRRRRMKAEGMKGTDGEGADNDEGEQELHQELLRCLPSPSTGGSPSSLSSLSLPALTALSHRMRDGLEVRDRFYHMKRYKRCFLGTDAVRWLAHALTNALKETGGQESTFKAAWSEWRAAKLTDGGASGGGGTSGVGETLGEEAVERALVVGNRMIAAGLFNHVVAGHLLENKKLFYRFASGDGEGDGEGGGDGDGDGEGGDLHDADLSVPTLKQGWVCYRCHGDVQVLVSPLTSSESLSDTVENVIIDATNATSDVTSTRALASSVSGGGGIDGVGGGFGGGRGRAFNSESGGGEGGEGGCRERESLSVVKWVQARVKKAKETAWIPDEASSICMQCSIRFTVTRRRHHCRLCGVLACAECTRYSVQYTEGTGTGTGGRTGGKGKCRSLRSCVHCVGDVQAYRRKAAEEEEDRAFSALHASSNVGAHARRRKRDVVRSRIVSVGRKMKRWGGKKGGRARDDEEGDDDGEGEGTGGAQGRGGGGEGGWGWGGGGGSSEEDEGDAEGGGGGEGAVGGMKPPVYLTELSADLQDLWKVS